MAEQIKLGPGRDSLPALLKRGALYTTETAAEIMGLNRRYVDEMCRRGKLKPVFQAAGPKGTWYITQEALAGYLKPRTKASAD